MKNDEYGQGDMSSDEKCPDCGTLLVTERIIAEMQSAVIHIPGSVQCLESQEAAKMPDEKCPKCGADIRDGWEPDEDFPWLLFTCRTSMYQGVVIDIGVQCRDNQIEQLRADKERLQVAYEKLEEDRDYYKEAAALPLAQEQAHHEESLARLDQLRKDLGLDDDSTRQAAEAAAKPQGQGDKSDE